MEEEKVSQEKSVINVEVSSDEDDEEKLVIDTSRKRKTSRPVKLTKRFSPWIEKDEKFRGSIL